MNAKNTATELPKTTSDQKSATAASATAEPVTVAALPSADGPIKNASTAISSMSTAEMMGTEVKSITEGSSAAKAEEKRKAPTKMKIASSIYLRMSKEKNMTRKQIVEQFVLEAKLSPAGASTYYQLIKAKLG